MPAATAGRRTCSLLVLAAAAALMPWLTRLDWTRLDSIRLGRRRSSSPREGKGGGGEGGKEEEEGRATHG